MNKFAAFILTHGRPDNVKTYKTLLKHGYTGQVFLIVDNLDKTASEYEQKYPGKVIIFDKKEIAKSFDQGDNFDDMRAIIYARNACFEIAKKLDLDYFIQLDDDYVSFDFRFTDEFDYLINPRKIKSLDGIFSKLVNFLSENKKVSSIALSQNGDFIGGKYSRMAGNVYLKRKAMNSFICSTNRPFKFIGRINEDVNTYTCEASKGLLLFTFNQVSLQQTQTQKSSGGMTDLYLNSGTYVKSFYSVMFHPSSVTIKLMRSKNPRLHHNVNWDYTAPKILRESVKYGSP